MRAVRLLLVAVTYLATGASSVPVNQCNPSQHICHGVCPRMPTGAELAPDNFQDGLCLRDSVTTACVCWLRSPGDEQQMQTLFKCQAGQNQTHREVMCLPPPFCFPPDVSLGCLIIPHCPCDVISGRELSGWYPVAAIILRSRIPVPAVQPDKEQTAEQPQGEAREFSMKHLLFLLAFVIAPLLCWCLLTFFHEGKCRKKRRPTPETEPMPTDRIDETGESCLSSQPRQDLQQPQPTAPKVESPPPYREALDPGESCLLAADCGPPPSYEDVVRNSSWPATVFRIQEANDP